MEKFCAHTTSCWQRTFLYCVATAILIAPPPQAWAVNVNSDTTISADTTDQQVIIASDITLTNDAIIDVSGSSTINITNQTGVTIINNAGATLNTDNTNAIFANGGADNLTIINSGTISSDANRGIFVGSGATGFSLTNNAGASITAQFAAINMSGSAGTITNSGTMSSGGSTIQTGTGGTGAVTIINNAGGIIKSTGSGNAVVRLEDNDTLINSGSIIRENSPTSTGVRIGGDNNTITLKEGSILVGKIEFATGTTGNTLQIEQGFGQSYFYDTSGTGTFTLEDLSGNTAVKGSAGSVGQGANESVDELLGLRTFNLRSALKRYSAFPKQSRGNQLYAEPFSFYSKRGTNSSVLGYETYGGGINFIYPLKQHNLELILSVGHSKQNIKGDHDISRNNFLAGVNATDFASLGNFKFSGFFVAGMEFHQGTREIFTNTTSSGKLDVTSDYTSYEAITGSQVSYSYSPDDKNTWKTEVGLTFGYSATGDYNERQYFFWEERHLVQGSVLIGEQLTSKINDKLTVIVGGELEHRTVLAGRDQSYAINGTTVDYRNGSFYENTAAGNLGARYAMGENMLAYVNLDSRFSNQTRGTYGASMGIQISF